MEFINEQNVLDILQEIGIQGHATGDEGELVYLRMHEVEGAAEGIVHIHVADPSCELEPHDGARELQVSRDKMCETVSNIIQQLHLSQVAAVPVGRWRKVFDCVAFSLAENEAWTEVDATATVELNRRDPLLFDPSDYHTLEALIGALLNDAESEDQGLMLTTTAAPVLIEVVPAGALRISVGNSVLADEVLDTVKS